MFRKTAMRQSVARFKMLGSFQNLGRTGRPKVTSQRDDHMIKEDGCVLTHHFE